jgi:hypothetical protein
MAIMKKKRAVFVFLVCFLISPALWAQNSGQSQSAYLDTIMRELMSAVDRPSRDFLLQYLTQVVQSGSIDPAVFDAIALLAHEGVTNPAHSGGRLVNNFPDIRAKACALLGKIKTAESKDNLLMVLRFDSDSMVLEAAIQALISVGMNENDEVVFAIAGLQQRRNGLNQPSNTLAVEILNAYEYFAPTAKRPEPMVQSVLAIVTDYRYVSAVRKQATGLLQKLLKS